MKKEIVINATTSESRIAMLEDEKLVELFVERPENERMVGNIYLGQVARVLSGIRAAFVNIGLTQDAFLHFDAISESMSKYISRILNIEKNNHSQAKPSKVFIKAGQPVLVQVVKEPIANKGPRVTSEISIAGRFLILVPHGKNVGISRKIVDLKEKKRLKQMMKNIKPKGFGLIVRTVGEGKEENVFQSDLKYLMKIWKRIESDLKKEKPPKLIYKDVGVVSSVIRDLFTNDIDRLILDSGKLHREIKGYLKSVAPKLLPKLEYYKGKKPIFDKYNIEADITKSLQRKVRLKKGGYIIIDHTEALVAIDVNSGSYSTKKGHEKNALSVNLEAASEIARQVRIRDIGGIIVLDFIDMENPAYQKKVYQELRKEFNKDRSKTFISEMTKFGLIQMTRQRIRPSLIFTFNETCPTCGGTGLIVSKETVATQLEQWIKRFRSYTKERNLIVYLHPSLEEYFTTGYKSRVRQMMWKFKMKIKIVKDENLSLEQFKCISKRSQEDITDSYLT